MVAPPAAPLVAGPVVGTVATPVFDVVFTRPATLDTVVARFRNAVEVRGVEALIVVLAGVLNVVTGLVLKTVDPFEVDVVPLVPEALTALLGMGITMIPVIAEVVGIVVVGFAASVPREAFVEIIVAAVGIVGIAEVVDGIPCVLMEAIDSMFGFVVVIGPVIVGALTVVVFAANSMQKNTKHI